MKKRLKFLSPLVCAIALVAIAVCLLSYEDNYLWKVQELNLHLDTPLFFRQQMVVAGGLLTWLGTWFTEFFYHPVLGVGWLCLWWALLMVLAQRAFRIPIKWTAWLLVPVVLLLLTCVDLGYWLYYLKLRGQFFVATIGLCAACSAVWLFRSLPAKYYLRELMIVVSTAVLYPLVGFYGLLATLLMAIMLWRMEGEKTTSRIVGSVVAAAAIIVIPLIYYRLVYYQTSEANIYWTALPLFRMLEENTEYYIPYYIIVAFFCALAISYRRLPEGDVKHPLWWGLGQIAMLAVLVMGVKTFWYHDYNFNKELSMQRCMEQEDWNGILQEAADLEEEPTRAIVMMKNLALFRLGRQGNEQYRFRTGAKESNSKVPVNMTQVVGRSIYYYYGLPNYCYRWCLEDGVEYGWRAEYLKYMTRCALLNDEQAVARKYINMLRHTRYHREWAEQMAPLLDKHQELASHSTYAPILHLMNFEDKLNSDQAIVEQFLMYHFVYDPSPDTLYHEQAVYSALWTKDIDTFWPHFFRYAQEHLKDHMPTHLQEAAYLYGHLENKVDISHMPFDDSVKQTYDAFMQMAQRCNQMKMNEEQMREAFYPQFGKTFYYEYFLIRNQKLY